MLVKPGTLPKTSSGKLQRAKCRGQYLDEQLDLA
jgi:fatty-acyl-CoA synthase